MRSPVNHVASLAALALLSACGGAGDSPRTALAQPAATGPAADYPVVVGEAFTIGSTTYTPIDRMNFDAVGYASIGTEGGQAISAANKTLPLPSYVEVTALDSGKTILVRVERRGPMRNDRLIELSPGAAAQLGVSGGVGDRAPVRVRRVNPPEAERALLRSGSRAPERMETPKPLLAVLLRRIDPQVPVLLNDATATQPATPQTTPQPAPKSRPTPAAIPSPAPSAAAAPVRAAAPVPSAPGFIIQIAAFASRANADASAAKVGGRVTPFGKLFRVRSGPFATRAAADAALAKAKAAGYSDARIQRAD